MADINLHNRKILIYFLELNSIRLIVETEKIRKASPILIVTIGLINLFYGIYILQSIFNFSFSLLWISIGSVLTSGGIIGLLERRNSLNSRFASFRDLRQFLLFILLALLIIQTTIVAGILSTTIRISNVGVINVGVIKTIGAKAYSDSECTQELSSIDWGTLEPGSTKSFTIYIKNEGNVDVTLNLSTENWNPESASNYITISWNYDGSSIAPGQVLQITLNLRVSNSVSGVDNFSFDIVITAVETG